VVDRTASAAGHADVNCPLCSEHTARAFARVGERDYFSCDTCGLVHLARSQRLSREHEHAHYNTHENSPVDVRYRAFLNTLAAPLIERLPTGAEGLDFGSGPGPTLSVMLAEQGFQTSTYDPFFAPDRRVLNRTYDFVSCSETIEHFFDPGEEFRRLDGLLGPRGWLGIMTTVLRTDEDFPSWHYHRDPTHVSFFRVDTLEWIAARYGWTLVRPHVNVALFQQRA
jgi:hypothetical protein